MQQWYIRGQEGLVYEERLVEIKGVSEAFRSTQRRSVNSSLKITRLNTVRKERKLLSMPVCDVLLH